MTKPEMDCINLREQFGNRFRIAFDFAHLALSVPRDKFDPWMMLVEFRGGSIDAWFAVNKTYYIEMRRTFAKAAD